MKIRNKIFLILIFTISITMSLVYLHYLSQKKDYNEFIEQSINSSINKIRFDILKVDNILKESIKSKSKMYISLHKNIMKQLQDNNQLDIHALKKELDEQFPSGFIATHLYLINSDNVIYKTTYKKDLHLDMSYLPRAIEYIGKARKTPNKVFIENPSFDLLDKKYRVYSYALLDAKRNIVLELSFFDTIANQFKNSMYKFNVENSIVKELDVFVNYGTHIANLTADKKSSALSKQEFINQRIYANDKESKIVKDVSKSGKIHTYRVKENNKVFKIFYSNISEKINEKNYVLKAKLDITKFANKLNTLRLELYITLLISLFFIMSLYLFLTIYFTKPLENILNNMDSWEKIENSSILNKNDELSHLANSFNKIYDEQTKIKLELQQQVAIINTVLDVTDNSIFYKNYQTQKGNYIGCNNSFKKLLERENQDILNHNDIGIFGEELGSFFQNEDKEVIKKRKTIEYKNWVLLPNYNNIYVHSRKAPIFNSDGSILGIVGIVRDITDELNHKRKLEKLNHSLEQRVQEEVNKNRLKEQQIMEQSRLAQMGEMISMIAHQWRQPLGSIGSAIIGLKLQLNSGRIDFQKDENLKNYKLSVNDKYDDISTYVQFLSTTIDDFRSFFKPDKEKEFVDISSPVLRALHIVENSMITMGIHIKVNYLSNDTIFIFQNEVMQVILNILKNSEDNFKEKNIQNKEIYIEVSKNNNNLVISIEDTGGGIPLDVLPFIFDPYFSTKGSQNGTGIGLYMSKVIIEEHNNGKLEVSNTNEGVCFKIILNKD